MPNKDSERSIGVGSKPVQESQGVVLRISGRLKESAATVFNNGMFPEVQQALLEFGDNLMAAASREPGITTQGFFHLGTEQIRVLGTNETGMDKDGIGKMLTVGDSDQKSINERGVGVKFAMWHLANGAVIVAKKAGDDKEYTFSDPKFGDPSVPYEGERPIQSRTVPSNQVETGRVETILTGLKPHPRKIPGINTFAHTLSEVYRPRLADEVLRFNTASNPDVRPRVVVGPNGLKRIVPDRIVMWVTNERNNKVQARPMPIPLKEGYTEDLKVTWTQLEDAQGNRVDLEPVPYWVGEKNPNDPAAAKVDPGLRIYYEGRLVQKREWLGEEGRDAALGLVVGEAHLDHVSGIKGALSMNKSNGIAPDSVDWQRAKDALRRAVTPFFEELKNRPAIQEGELPLYFVQEFARAKFLAESVIGEILVDDQVAAESLAEGMLGVVRGQAKPTEGAGTGYKPRDVIQGKKWSDQEPQTTIGKGASPDIKRKRKGFVSGIEGKAFPEGDQRVSALLVESSPKPRKVLQINTSHPLTVAINREAAVNPKFGRARVKELVAHEMIMHASMEEADGDMERFRGKFDLARWRLGEKLLQEQLLNPSEIAGSEKKKKK